MAYTAPVLAEFRARFPDFEATDAAINFALADAGNLVDISWLERDYATAILFLAAHWLTVLSGDGADAPGQITAESFGPLSVSYADNGGTGSEFATTGYGRRYLELRKGNFPGIAIAEA